MWQNKMQILVMLCLTQSIVFSVGTGASMSVGGGITIERFTDTSVVMGKKLNCSRDDFSNGTLCMCGTTLQQQCSSVRSAGGDACSKCVRTASPESECTQQMEQQFCESYVTAFDFRWIDDVPTPLKNATPIRGYDMNCFCLSEIVSPAIVSQMQNLLRKENFNVEIFQVLGCDNYMLEGFAMQMGIPTLNGDPGSNDTDWVVHGDTFDYLIECCKNWQAPACNRYEDPALKTFYILLKKLTGCQRDRLETEFETFGVADVDIGSSLFREFYTVDLRKMSFVVQPIIPIAVGLLYGVQLRFILGLTLGAAAKHGRGNSWFMPGADRIYADTFKAQGDFYFPSTIPSPMESQGTCGTSSSSEVIRLDVCEKVGTYMYDNARISGMSIIGCFVDCTESRLENVEGAFIAVSLIIVEIDTDSVGFGKHHGGLKTSIDLLNKEGMNITNDVKATVGIGFHFAVDLLGTEDLLTTILWSESTQHNKNFTAVEYTPNVTAAMLAYTIPKNTKGKKHNAILNTSEIVLIASFVAVVLGVVIGISIRRVKNTGQAAHTNNVEYEEAQPLPDLSSEA